MTHTLKVIVLNQGRNSHPLLTYIADAEDNVCFSAHVNHRDMRQVRAYYNGLLSGWSMLHIGGHLRYDDD